MILEQQPQPLEALVDSVPTAPVEETLIVPSAGWQVINLAELLRSSELIYCLAWRDVKVRYKQTALGIAWAVLQPGLMMLVFAAVLGGLAGASSGEIPYPLFLYAGLVAWTFFASAVTGAANSIVASEGLIKKVYFPRLAIPLSAVCVALVDFAIALSVLGLLMAWYAVPLTVGAVWAPLTIGLLMIAGLGLGTLFAAWNVAYRDFRYLVGFLVQLGMFATPAIYLDLPPQAEQSGSVMSTAWAKPSSAAADALPAAEALDHRGSGWAQRLLRLNPLNGLIDAFRASMLGRPIVWSELAYSGVATLVISIVGLICFRRVEDSFADLI